MLRRSTEGMPRVSIVDYATIIWYIVSCLMALPDWHSAAALPLNPLPMIGVGYGEESSLLTVTVSWQPATTYPLNPPLEFEANLWVGIDWPDEVRGSLYPVSLAAGRLTFIFYQSAEYGLVLGDLFVGLPDAMEPQLLAEAEAVLGKTIAQRVASTYEYPIPTTEIEFTVAADALLNDCQARWQAIHDGHRDGTVVSLPTPPSAWLQRGPDGTYGFQHWEIESIDPETWARRILERLDLSDPDADPLR